MNRRPGQHSVWGVKLTASDKALAERDALEAFEKVRWPSGAVCPRCERKETVKRIEGKSLQGWYHCSACRYKFNLKTGTVFGRSKIPLVVWVMVRQLSWTRLSLARIARDCGVTEKTAKFMLKRLGERGEKYREQPHDPWWVYPR